MAPLPRVWLIDNDDSFTYNIVELLRRLPCEWALHRWRNISPSMARSFTHIIFSPGPGIPDEYGPLFRLLDDLPSHRPLLGICLGHQVLARHYGAPLLNLHPPVHGQAHAVRPCRPSPLWKGLPVPFQAGLYHSWAVSSRNLPPPLIPTAFSDAGVLMALQVQGRPWFGVQFHPESHLTPHGERLMRNFLDVPGKE